MEKSKQIVELETSLLDLHGSVDKLIKLIKENSTTLSRSEEVLNKLPLLDFYNDDLLSNIKTLQKKIHPDTENPQAE